MNRLIFAFSAPNDSLPPPLNTQGTSSDVRHDDKTRATVSDIRREVADTHAKVSDIRGMLKSRDRSATSPAVESSV